MSSINPVRNNSLPQADADPASTESPVRAGQNSGISNLQGMIEQAAPDVYNALGGTTNKSSFEVFGTQTTFGVIGEKIEGDNYKGSVEGKSTAEIGGSYGADTDFSDGRIGADFGIGGGIEGNYKADFDTSTDLGGTDVDGSYSVEVDYSAGANAGGSADVTLNENGGGVTIGGEAFVGARAGIEGSATVGIDGYEFFEVFGGAEVGVGAGIKGGLNVGFNDRGDLIIGVGFGGTVGGGASSFGGIRIGFGDIGQGIQDLGNAIGEGLQDLGNAIGDVAEDIAGGIGDFGGDVWEGVENAGSWVADTASDAWNSFTDWLSDVFSDDEEPASASPSGKTEGTDDDDDDLGVEEEEEEDEEPAPEPDQGGGGGYVSDFGDSGFPDWWNNPHIHIPGGGGQTVFNPGGEDDEESPNIGGRATGSGDEDDQTERATVPPGVGPYVGDEGTFIHPKANPALFSVLGGLLNMDTLQVSSEAQDGASQF